MPAPTTAVAAANEFLKLARAEGQKIDQMKLQKLLFYAHAWFLGMGNGPLFSDPVEAWPWGPVVRNVYSETVQYGRAPVSELLTDMIRCGPNALDFRFERPDGVEHAETAAYIKSVWDSYKTYTGIQLSNTTHGPGEPWTVVRDRIGHLNQKPVIPNELIEGIFKRKTGICQQKSQYRRSVTRLKKPDTYTRKSPDMTGGTAPKRVLFINLGFFKYGTEDKTHAGSMFLSLVLLIVMATIGILGLFTANSDSYKTALSAFGAGLFLCGRGGHRTRLNISTGQGGQRRRRGNLGHRPGLIPVRPLPLVPNDPLRSHPDQRGADPLPYDNSRLVIALQAPVGNPRRP